MVNNLELIKPLLKFESEDDFYFVQIIQRKKDNQGGINGSNNSARLIKAYYIKSVGSLDRRMDEIIKLCEVFNARAGINLNKRSFEKTALMNVRKCMDIILNKSYSNVSAAYNSVCGEHQQSKDKFWILDIDAGGLMETSDVQDMIEYINSNCRPDGDKYVASIPSKSGVHVITKPFEVPKFLEQYPDIEIHKNNPTNLYIP